MIDRHALPDPGETGDYAVLGSRAVHAGHVFDVVVDRVRMPSGDVRERDVVRHPGAVGVIALDAAGQVLLIRQYRHAVGRHLLELPAGVLDVDGEPGSRAAARELAEEVGLVASRWDLLVEAYSSSGMSDEAVRVFLARDVAAAADTGYERVDEEAEISPRWVPLDEAVSMVQRGEVTNALCVMGLLAAARARDGGWTGLRPVTTRWEGRPTHTG